MQNPSHTCPQCQSPIAADAPGGLCPACVLLGVAGPTNPSQTIAASAPTIEEIAAAFPELEILEMIGQGGMGIVFKARQPRLDRFVALKILPPALAAQPGFAERFTREARVLARLAHPHIVAIYDFGESAGFFYLIMEFVNGVNLRAAMRAGVKPEQALLLVPQICEALQFAHDHGVLHRDIKPENILLDTTGTPKLADFGIAKLTGDGTDASHATHASHPGLTQTGATLGTAAYMAPEQIEKPATVDHRADIYSLGVVLYELLTGELPLGRFAAPSEKSDVNSGVDEVVLRALEKERERRQQSATAMKTEVEQATQNKSARTRTRIVADPAPNPWPHRLVWFVVALLVPYFVGVLIAHFVSAEDIHKWPRASGVMPYFFSLAAVVFGYRRTRPGADRAIPRAAWNPWPERAFFVLVALISMPPILIGLFVWVLRSHNAKPPKLPAHAQTSSFPKPVAIVTTRNPPFIGAFSQGSIELVAVAPHSEQGARCWRMDGGPAVEGPFLTAASRSQIVRGQIARDFIFHTRDLPANASGLSQMILDSRISSGVGFPELAAEPGKPLSGYHFFAATFPDSQRSADFRVGIALGQWHTLAENPPGNSIPASTEYAERNLVISQGATFEEKGGTNVYFVAQPQEDLWHQRLVAVTTDGKEIAASSNSQLNGQSEWRFENLPLKSIQKFRFQVRLIEWVEFRGVALARNTLE